MSGNLIKYCICSGRDGTNERIYYIGVYHKYWTDKGKRIRNPAFDEYSANILRLKRGRMAAIKYFYRILNETIPDNKNIMICTVPSSNPKDNSSGIKRLVSILAKKKHLIDGTDLLVRTIQIQKLADGGVRSRQVHYDSVKVEWDNIYFSKSIRQNLCRIKDNAMVKYLKRCYMYWLIMTGFYGKAEKMLSESDICKFTVILLDDVTTSGNSLMACRDILMDNGIKNVYMLALGKTSSENGEMINDSSIPIAM